MNEVIREQILNKAIAIETPCAALLVQGSDHLPFLNNVLSQDILSMSAGEWKEAALLSATSHVLSLMTVIKKDSSIILLSVDGQCESIKTNLDKFIIAEDVSIENVSEKWKLIELWGKNPEDLILGFNINALIEKTSRNNRRRVFFESQQKFTFDAVPDDQQLREVLRIENGLLEYGIDINEKIMLSETRLEKIAASETKGCYPGQEVVAKIETYKRLNRSFLKFTWDTDALPEKNSLIYDLDRKENIGCLTSRVYSPFLKKSIGLGWLKRGYYEAPRKVLIGSHEDFVAEAKPL